MKKPEIVKIGHLEFRKDCAKGMTLAEFKKSFSHKNFDSLDKDKAYVTLGGKKKVEKEAPTKKEYSKDKKDYKK
jgi:hypothetical protein